MPSSKSSAALVVATQQTRYPYIRSAFETRRGYQSIHYRIVVTGPNADDYYLEAKMDYVDSEYRAIEKGCGHAKARKAAAAIMSLDTLDAEDQIDSDSNYAADRLTPAHGQARHYKDGT